MLDFLNPENMKGTTCFMRKQWTMIDLPAMFYEKTVNNFLNSEQKIIYAKKRTNNDRYACWIPKKLMIWYGISLIMCFWQRIILPYTNSKFTSKV